MLTRFPKPSSTVSLLLGSHLFPFTSPPRAFRLRICFSDPDALLSPLSKDPFTYLLESRGREE